METQQFLARANLNLLYFPAGARSCHRHFYLKQAQYLQYCLIE